MCSEFFWNRKCVVLLTDVEGFFRPVSYDFHTQYDVFFSETSHLETAHKPGLDPRECGGLPNVSITPSTDTDMIM